MLHIKGLSKHYGSKVLFEGAEANLDDQDRVALIGPNGAGKSTLIKLILGQEHSDGGDIIIPKNTRIGHLAQELPKFENRTVFEEVLRLDGRRDEILRLKADLEEKLADEHTEADLKNYGRVLEELDGFDEYRLPSRAEQILEGVGFEEKDFHRNLSELSGGWLMRVALARVLLLQPDLLILDEPTNHLDLESLLWLEEFLKSYPGALLIVSHDRSFLNRLIGQVWEIDQQRINVYNGNLDAYVVQKEERLKVMEAQHAGQQAKIAEMRSFVERFGAKATKARQAQSRMKQIEKMEATMIDLPEERSNIGFRFPSCPPSGKEVITMKNAAMRFHAPDGGQKTVFEKFDWILQRGSRVAIVGVNGAGKTTLLKALSDTLPLSDGTIKLGHQVQVGYYSQLQAESLNLKHTILEELEITAPKMDLAQVRAVAGAFLFLGDDVFKKIGVLSGGEKARVALAKLLLMPNNFLLLDEPTNHLDAESREVLLQALINYEGTLCLVSHDREFVGPLVDQLLEIQDQRVTPLVLNYEEYLAKKILETRERLKKPQRSGTLLPGGIKAESQGSSASSGGDTRISNGAPKISNNQLRAYRSEFAKLETEIQKLETRQAEINQRLSTEDFAQNAVLLRELIDEQSKNQQNLDQKFARWEELGGLLG
jgi:ATP-binding cassette subfamily F protein 3